MSVFDSSAAAGGAALDPIAATIKNPFSTTVKNDGARPQDFPEGWEIFEYSDGKQVSYLQLLGNLMPMVPFEWDNELRMTKDYYPGRKEAVVHVMGFKQGPVTIKGRFKDKRYKDPAYYGVAYQYTKALQVIQERGNLLKFGFEGSGGKWIRWGFLEKTSFKLNKLSWIDYELTFFVVSDVQPINDFFADPEKSAPDGVNFNLISAAADFQATYSSVPTTMPSSIAGKINQLTSGVAKNINLVTNFVKTIVDTGADIAAASHRALGLIANARKTLSSLNRQIDDVAHSFSSLSFSGLRNDAKAISTYKNMAFIHQTVAAAHPLHIYLVQMKTQFEAIALTVPIARYRVVKFDTLQKISIKFYGSVDNWEKIQIHNKLQTNELVLGTILEIPHL